MTLAERISDMSDADLASLRANAIRLSEGDSARKRKATELLPALEAEVSARKVRLAETKASAISRGAKAQPEAPGGEACAASAPAKTSSRRPPPRPRSVRAPRTP